MSIYAYGHNLDFPTRPRTPTQEIRDNKYSFYMPSLRSHTVQRKDSNLVLGGRGVAIVKLVRNSKGRSEGTGPDIPVEVRLWGKCLSQGTVVAIHKNL